MIPWLRKTIPTDSPVLVMDALGFATNIKSCDAVALAALGYRLERQYYRFRSKIPFRAMLVTPNRVFGSKEFSTFRLNDMFVLYSRKPQPESMHRHLVAGLLLFQVMLTEGFIPRGGLGVGLVLRKRDSILGPGFIDAYESSENREAIIRHICGIRISERFLARLRRSTMSYKLLSFYRGHFFLNPRALTDPEMGSFDDARIRRLLTAAGANNEKLDATMRFLKEAEDCESAASPDSRSRAFLSRHAREDLR